MAFQISGTSVIDNARKGIFQSMNPGASGSDPSSPVTGDIYYNTTYKIIYVYNGSAWIPQQ